MTTYNNTPAPALPEQDDWGFGGQEEKVVKPTLQRNPQAIWMTGILSTTTRETAVGLHVPADVNPRLDERCAALGYRRYIVIHKTGDVREKPYWNLNWNDQVCSIFPIAYGLKSTWEMGVNMEDRTGIAYAVGVAKTEEGDVIYNDKGEKKQRPQMELRFFVHELLDQTNPELGFDEWFHLSVANYMVDHLYQALNRQIYVTNAYVAMRAAQGVEDVGPFWGFSIPLVPGKPADAGKKKQQTTTIIPMVAKVPELPATAPETAQYLKAHRIPRYLQERLKGEAATGQGDRKIGLLDDTLLWSYERSVEVKEGKQDQVTVTEEAIEGASVTLPQLPPADPPVNQQQLDWIRANYAPTPATEKSTCKTYGVSSLPELKQSQYQAMFDALNG